ncbi:MAG: TetR/AcrR family transcriptional regulator [Candidatus Binatia bacterium]
MALRLKKVGTRGEHTREAILRTAERRFADRGFTDTRLEDIAGELGITRPALVYYFTSKRELYDCVLENVFGELVDRVRAVSAAADAPNEQIEAMVSTWIAYAGERPTFVRIYLREVANATPTMEPAITRYTDKLNEVLIEVLRAGEAQGLFRPVDPMHLVSSFVGATVQYIGVLPTLGLDSSFDPLEKERLAAHREDVLANVRRILEPGKPRPLRAADRRRRSR